MKTIIHPERCDLRHGTIHCNVSHHPTPVTATAASTTTANSTANSTATASPTPTPTSTATPAATATYEGSSTNCTKHVWRARE